MKKLPSCHTPNPPPPLFSLTATVDVKRHVYDLCVNYDDRLLALVEFQLEMDAAMVQSCVRLYGVGRVRGDEDMVRPHSGGLGPFGVVRVYVTCPVN